MIYENSRPLLWLGFLTVCDTNVTHVAHSYEHSLTGNFGVCLIFLSSLPIWHRYVASLNPNPFPKVLFLNSSSGIAGLCQNVLHLVGMIINSPQPFSWDMKQGILVDARYRSSEDPYQFLHSLKNSNFDILVSLLKLDKCLSTWLKNSKLKYTSPCTSSSSNSEENIKCSRRFLLLGL